MGTYRGGGYVMSGLANNICIVEQIAFEVFLIERTAPLFTIIHMAHVGECNLVWVASYNEVPFIAMRIEECFAFYMCHVQNKQLTWFNAIQ